MMRKYQGLLCVIENPKGSVRSGTDRDGHSWSTTMPYDYGYLVLAEGVDGDKLDVMLGPSETSDKVFVVHQKDPASGQTDEFKVMLGWGSKEAAREAFDRGYDKQGFRGVMDEMTMAEFRERHMGERVEKPAELAKAGPVNRARLVLVPAPTNTRVRRWQHRAGVHAVNWVKPVESLERLPKVLYHGSRQLGTLIADGISARPATELKDTDFHTWGETGHGHVSWGPKVWHWFQELLPNQKALLEAQAGRQIKSMEDLRQVVSLYWTAVDPETAWQFAQGSGVAQIDPSKVSMYGWFVGGIVDGEVVLVCPAKGPHSGPDAVKWIKANEASGKWEDAHAGARLVVVPAHDGKLTEK